MKKGIAFIVLIFWFHAGLGSPLVTGPSTGTVGQTATYTYDDGSVYTTFSWALAYGFGTITSSTSSGSTYTATIHWTASGSEVVRFTVNGSTVSSKGVTIGCPTLTTPTAGFAYPNTTSACQGVLINYSYDDNINGVAWFWQTSSTGTSTANSGLSYTATASGIYYLRANCGSAWSNAQATASVTVKPIPTVSGSNQTFCSGTTTSIVLTNNLPSTLNSWTVTANLVSGASNSSGTSGSSSPYTYTLAQTLTATSGSQGSAAYRVTPSLNGCTGTTIQVMAYVNPFPTVYSVGGGGQICSGTSTSVTLSGSQNGFYYYLSPSGGRITGTGSPISWTGLTAGGNYTVMAASVPGDCETTMSGNAPITVNSLPTASVSGGGSACAGSVPSVIFTFTGTAPFTFTFSNGSTPTTVSNYAPSTYTITNPANGTYSVTSLQHSNGCYASSLGSPANVTTFPIPTASVSAPNQTVCSGSTATINISNPNNVSGTNFSWTTVTTNATVPPVTSPGNVISGVYKNSDGINTGTATYTITPFTSTCTGTPVNASVTINNVPVPPNPETYLAYGQSPASFQLSVPTGTQANWYYTPTTPTPFNTTASFQNTAVTDPDTYYVSLKDLATLCESVRIAFSATRIPVIISPVNVTKEVVRVPGMTSDGGVNQLNNTTQKAVTVSYQDGLARTVQVQALRATPLQLNIIQPVEYDSYGRPSKSYLPYTRTDPAHFQLSYQSDQSGFYLASGDKIANDAYPFAVAKYEASPLGRPVEQGNAGQAWQAGTSHSTKLSYSFNAIANSSDSVWMFKGDPPALTTYPTDLTISSYDPVNTTVQAAHSIRLLPGFATTGGAFTGKITINTQLYPDNQLTRIEKTDENGNKEILFKDALGRTIAYKKQLNGIINGAAVNYLQTYYVYDALNRLRYIIPPGGLAALKANGWIMSQAILDQHLHQFVYDDRGRLTQKKTPGQAWIYYGYDKFNRLVLIQDGNLRPLNKWAFVKYDLRGHAVMEGLYKNTSQTDITTIQPILDGLYAGTNPYYELRGTALYGYTNQSFPMVNADNSPLEILNVTYYDNYDFDNNGTPDYSYDNTHLSGLPTSTGLYIRGVPTGGRKLILGTTNWLVSAVFYDNYGHIIQSQSNNHLNLAALDKSSAVYDFEGKVLQTKTYHNGGGTNQVTTVQTLQYDATGRLTGVKHSINGAPDQLVSQYQYNEIGQLVTKQLHNTGGSNFLQNVDYRYNIRGWLSSINNANLSDDAGVTNSDANDYFGMELFYNTSETSGLGNTAYYNGNMSALKWKGIGYGNGAIGQRSYKFSYDKTDKLLTASFQKYGTAAWDQEQNTLNESLTYDHNGNILTLQRNQNQRGLNSTTVTSTPQAIDNLTYTYAAGNQLSKVNDATAMPAGFSDGANVTTEYTYDTHGNLTTDQNKGISGIIYNVLGKAQQITLTNGRVINYTYDASGTKLKMATTVSGTTTVTDYVNGFVYTNSSLNWFPSPEGRVVKNGNNWEYQYAIGDHQGNTRILFTAATPAAQAVTATFEAAAQAAEATSFQNYPSSSGINPVSAYNHTPGGTNSQYLNGGVNGKVGVAKSYKVYPGDKLKIEAYGKYNTPGGTGSGMTAFASALLAAFNLPAPAGGETGTASSAINTWGGIEAGGYANGSTDNTDPKAFVNIILFDKNYNFLDVAYAQIVGGGGAPVYLTQSYTVKEAGYAYLYISNEHPTYVDIYFDDVTMTYTPSYVLQYSEYYPFGLQTPNSWTRDNSTNNFLYDAGNELNTTSGFYDLPFRNYDAALGRFFQIDPLAHKDHSTSPFGYAANNPILFNDPSGLMVPENSSTWTTSQFRAYFYSQGGNQGSFQDWAQENGIFGVGGSGGGGGGGSSGGGASAYTISVFVPDPQGGGGGLNIMYTFDQYGNYLANVSIAGTSTNIGNFFNDVTITDLTSQGGQNGAGGESGESSNPAITAANGFLAVTGLAVDHTKEAMTAAEVGFKGVKVASRSVIVAIALIAGIQLGTKIADRTAKNSDYARAAGAGVIIGAGFIPAAGPFISFGLGMADATGAFEGFYLSFDNPAMVVLYLNSLHP